MVVDTTGFEKARIRELALGTRIREGRWKEEANNLLPGTMSISSFSYTNRWELSIEAHPSPEQSRVTDMRPQKRLRLRYA